MDMDDLYIEYDDLVQAGEIDPSDCSAEDYAQSRFEEMIDRAEMYADLER